MNIVIDENMPAELTDRLKAKGHRIFLAPKGSSDEVVALLAKEQNSILLTQNRHFTNILRFPPKDFSGIVRIKIHPSYIEDIIFSLEKLLEVFPQQKDFKGKLIILEKDGFFKVKE